MSNYISSNKVLYHPEAIQEFTEGKCVKPITAELHISNKCNNKCYYCGQEKMKDKTMMKWEDIKQALHFIKDIGCKSVYFSGGGEPSVNKNFVEALCYADKLNLSVGVITNGLAISDYVYMLRYCKWIRISVDSFVPQVYKQIRGCNKLEEVKKNIVELLETKSKRSYKCIIGLQIVVNKYNCLHIEEEVRLYKQAFPSINYIQVRPIETLISQRPYTERELELIKNQIDKIRLIEGAIVSDKWNLLINDKRIFGFSKCYASDFLITVDARGDVYQCCHVIKNPAYKICDIHEADFFTKRKEVVGKIRNKGFNPDICLWACRGSGVNAAIENYINEPHKNFL